jgi:hypothetical protein
MSRACAAVDWMMNPTVMATARTTVFRVRVGRVMAHLLFDEDAAHGGPGQFNAA